MIEHKKAPSVQASEQGLGTTNNQHNCSTIDQKLCSGLGKYHSPNAKKDPKPLLTITLLEIESLLDKPQQVSKKDGRWFIPSTLLSRVHAEQHKEGNYFALWADIDETSSQSFTDIVDLADEIIAADFYAYTTRSATKENQKARIIVPLKDPLSGEDWKAMQKILNNKLEAVGIIPDRSSELTGQPCYLPNKGEYYESHNEKMLGYFDANVWSDELIAELTSQAKIESERAAKVKAQKEYKPKTPTPAGGVIPSEYIKQNYNTKELLEASGAVFVSSKRFYPANSSNDGAPGGIYDPEKDRFFTHHSNDPFSDGYWHGAINLLCDLNGIDWSQDDALVRLCRVLEFASGVTIEQHNQKAYMEHKDAQETEQAFTELLQPTTSTTEENSAPVEPFFDLTRFSLRGMAEEMESKMLEDKFILGGMAILGQSTVFYAKPNAGKTLLTLWLLMEAIKADEINGEDIFYINADDNHKGLTHKLRLAEKHGFHMLAPGYNGFNPNQLSLMLAELVKQDTASGKVLILDTVKKFTDIMDKKVGSAFGESVRQFVAHGGSVIMLAHVNKHRDTEGELIFAGTSDLVDDADCAYTLDAITEDASTGEKTVKFENFKSRGDVSKEEVYRYDAGQGVQYIERLESVVKVSDEDREKAEKQKRLNSKYEKNLEAIDSIKEVIKEGITKKTELINAVVERTGLTKRKVTTALADHTGNNMAEYQYWHVSVKDKNAHVYQLNYGVF